MAYEKPQLIDLSRRSEKGFGEAGCVTGSGDIDACINGRINAIICEVGTVVRGEHTG